MVKSKNVEGFGSRAQQGTKPYLQDVAYEMIARGVEDKVIGDMILKELRKNKPNLEYLNIRQNYNSDGSLKPIEVNQFDISGKGYKDLRKKK